MHGEFEAIGGTRDEFYFRDYYKKKLNMVPNATFSAWNNSKAQHIVTLFPLTCKNNFPYTYSSKKRVFINRSFGHLAVHQSITKNRVFVHALIQVNINQFNNKWINYADHRPD